MKDELFDILRALKIDGEDKLFYEYLAKRRLFTSALLAECRIERFVFNGIKTHEKGLVRAILNYYYKEDFLF
jgi:hypothetical protein